MKAAGALPARKKRPVSQLEHDAHLSTPGHTDESPITNMPNPTVGQSQMPRAGSIPSEGSVYQYILPAV